MLTVDVPDRVWRDGPFSLVRYADPWGVTWQLMRFDRKPWHVAELVTGEGEHEKARRWAQQQIERLR